MSNSSTSPPWDDPRVTAFVLGELPENEAAQFTEEMNANPELATAVEEARAVTEQVESFFHSAAVPPLESNRVESIVRESETAPADEAPVSAGSAAGTAWFQTRWVQWFIAASVIGIIMGLSIPAVHTARELASDQRPTVGMIATDQSGPEVYESVLIEEEMPLEDAEMVYQPLDRMTAKSAPAEKKAEGESFGFQAGSRVSGISPAAEATSSDASPRTIAESSLPSANEQAVRSRRAKRAEDPTMEMGMDSMMGMGDMEMAGPAMEMGMGKDGTGMMGGGMGGMPAGEMLRLELDSQLATSTDSEPSAGKPMMHDFGFKPVPSSAPNQPASDRVALRVLGRSVPESEQEELTRGRAGGLPGFGVPATPDGEGQGPGMSGDKFEPITENEFRRVTADALSTFSIDVDTASYAKVRSYLQRGQLPRPASVRIEELINYFDYQYTPPSAEDPVPFSSAMAVASCPWNENNRLVRVGIQAKDIDRKERPRCNLVFLIDTSGSMKRPNKLPLVIEGMKVLLDQLKNKDRVAIVVYAGSSGLVLDSTPVKQKKKIVRALSALSAGGSTNGGAGLQLAYQTARENFIEDGVNRVILCSDGDFNVGMTGTDQLVAEATRQSKSGTELTVLGFGMGNHNDAMMERISNSGAGNYAFVDTVSEAKKVLADQVTGTLFTVAKDVKIQVEFNPAVVSAYRLIGYENRILAKEDFNDDKKDAGEIGAGHRVTALYEIAPVGKLPDSISPDVDPLKYQPTDDADLSSKRPTNEILTLKIRHKPPQGDVSEKLAFPLVNENVPFQEADTDFQFAAAVAGFGMQLRNSPQAGTWTMDDVIATATDAKGDDEHGLRAEFLELARTAKRLIVND
ncbi:VWA domain-containing protein [Rhodopirellula europaea]|jgi:Ca-activated chloride channel family protein|uniref:A von Willebrand factor type A (VWA) domain protein n=1 Tax=Rhodopirellula europaea SH398 TaxID=1263868 RepID=M5SMV2_9BACT|nr:VWA domain-containing protein [Rhodopirellula europaea]EMI29107.1 a von Willebrand factor type A (vWA) domain protein [Rhodopirellula europaea SH398]